MLPPPFSVYDTSLSPLTPRASRACSQISLLYLQIPVVGRILKPCCPIFILAPFLCPLTGALYDQNLRTGTSVLDSTLDRCLEPFHRRFNGARSSRFGFASGTPTQHHAKLPIAFQFLDYYNLPQHYAHAVARAQQKGRNRATRSFQDHYD